MRGPGRLGNVKNDDVMPNEPPDKLPIVIVRWPTIAPERQSV